jgi:hypothetical protein
MNVAARTGGNPRQHRHASGRPLRSEAGPCFSAGAYVSPQCFTRLTSVAHGIQDRRRLGVQTAPLGVQIAIAKSSGHT